MRLGHLAWALAIAGFWSVAAHAAALGSMRVGSYLGEPFVAEIPIELGADEKLEDVKADIASPEDFQILEVYRDPAVDALRVEVVEGTPPKVRLTSDQPIDAPFFNVVVKLSVHGVDYFKKFPVFLDPPPALAAPQPKPQPRAAAAKRKPPAKAETPAQVPAKPQVVAASAAKPTKPKATAARPGGRGQEGPTVPFKPYGGWARSLGVYGPVVYGDTLSTVARRLMVDNRYTLNQVMVALFRKNPEAFGEQNINILKAGAMLKVPTAEEVERISPDEATAIVRAHHRRWEELKRTRPEYARLAEAQRTRYSKRVRVGKTAFGTPAVAAKPAPKAKPEASAKPTQARASAAPKPESKGEESARAIASLRAELDQLRQMNESLQQQLAEKDKRISELEQKLEAAKAASPGELEAELAATKEQLKKLQIRLARMQAELDRARQEARRAREAAQPLVPDWVVYLMAALIVVLLGALGWLISRRSARPAAPVAPAPEEGAGVAAGEAAAVAAGAAAAAAAAAAEQEEVEEIEVEEVPTEGAEKAEAGQAEDVLTLTEEDTGSLEAFTSDLEEEEPDPNVDYLAEADVYLRYGLDEDAEKQLRLALKLDKQNVEAWAKLAKIYQDRGDEEGLAKIIEQARAKLSEEARARFDAMLEGEAPSEAAEGAEETVATEAAEAEKTMVMDVSELGLDETIVTEAPAEEAKEKEEGAGELEFDLGELGEGLSEETEAAPAPSAEGTGEGGSEGELEFTLEGLEETAATPEQAPEAAEEGETKAQAPEGELALDLESVAEAEATPREEKKPEQAGAESSEIELDLEGFGEAVGEKEPTEASAESEPQGGDAGLELEGLELEGLLEEESQPGEKAGTEATVAEEDLVGTVRISPQEAAGDEQAIDLDLEGLLAEEQTEGESAPESSREASAQEVASTEESEEEALDLGDELKDVDFDELENAVKELDEFVSTIGSATTLTPESAEEEKGEATLELDKLLDELGDEEEGKQNRDKRD